MKHSKRIAALAVLIFTTSGCTLEEINMWSSWHNQAPEAAEAYVQRPEVIESLTLDWDHDGLVETEQLAPAERLDPPSAPAAPSISGESSNGRCVGIVDALSQQSPGWDVNRMAGIAYRESRCQSGASNSCCSGLFQIHRIWIPEAAECGVYSRSDLYDPWKNICTAAIIYRTQGMGAWSTS